MIFSSRTLSLRYSIFALLWTQKMQKTRKWIILYALFFTVFVALDYLLYPSSDIILFQNLDSPYIEHNEPLVSFLNPIFYNIAPNENHEDVIFFLSFLLMALYELVVLFGVILVNVYFMLKWTTQYNLKNFKYKSKREWKKVNLPKRDWTNTLKNAGIKIILNLKNIGKKIPSEKMKDTSINSAKKITESAKSITSSNMNPSQIRDEIEKYYNMMLLGVISESDFEKKKVELLNL